MFRAVCTIASLIWVMAAGPGLADSVSPDRIRALVERGEILPLEEILKRNQSGIGGRVIEIELEREKEAYLYEIKILRPDGRYRELKIDARTGAVVREK
jgi:uncharacterized membrane protein YkoI